jgi:hypothetical protein
MKIDFEKIINQTIITLVTAVFIGACVMVWKGATTVDDKVRATEVKLEVLIQRLSDSLATSQVQFKDLNLQVIGLTNTVSVLLAQTRMLERSLGRSGGFLSSTNMTNMFRPPSAAAMHEFNVEQKAISKDIYDSLKK